MLTLKVHRSDVSITLNRNVTGSQSKTPQDTDHLSWRCPIYSHKLVYHAVEMFVLEPPQNKL